MATPFQSQKSGSLTGTITVPGDKSISHRSLIFGALSIGTTEISGLLEAEDVLATATVLQDMGIPIGQVEGKWVVTGRGPGGLTEPENDLDFGNAGTGARLMMGVVGGNDMAARFNGDLSLVTRPMGRVLRPLQEMGVHVEETNDYTLPMTIKGSSDLVPIRYVSPVASAQVKSAILLAGLHAEGTTTVIEPKPTRDHTEKMVSFFGGKSTVEETPEGLAVSVEGGVVMQGKPISVPGDPSSTAFLVAAALICPGSDVLVKNVLVNPLRTGFYTTLKEMGADISFENERNEGGESVADIRARTTALKGVTVPAQRAPSMIDEYPVLAVLAAFADGETVMEGLDELRVKESDRLAATSNGLTACGVVHRIEDDTLIVTGSQEVEGGGRVETHLDHRIAMAFLTLGLQSKKPVIIDDAKMIATSFPNYISLMTGLGASLAKAHQ